MADRHEWAFFRSGGVNQVIIKSGSDLARLRELDLKLWMALSMPVRGTEIDPGTASLIDSDGDGKIRPNELIEAAEWACAALADPELLIAGGDGVSLSDIRDERARAGARRLLALLAAPESRALTLADLSAADAVLGESPCNGDGIVRPEAAEDPDLGMAIREILSVVGPAKDRWGKEGLSRERLDAFALEAQRYLAWLDQAVGSGIEAAAYDAVEAVRAKVDDYFARCRLASFDPRAANAVNRAEEDYRAIAPLELSLSSVEIASLPLAIAEGGKPLPLAGAVNPAWADRLADLADRAVRPLLGGDCPALSEPAWGEILSRLAPYAAWRATEPKTAAAAIPPDRLRFLVSDGALARLYDLIELDERMGAELEGLADLERLVRYKRDLARVARNFVNFADFYERGEAAFQAGTLYLDSRACRLCFEVLDEGRHASLAASSGACLVYCDISRPGAAPRRVVAAFTVGDSDGLAAGRNGVFVDRSGLDWDASVTRVVLNPISVRQAFWLPYKKFFRMVEEQVSKRAHAGEDAANERLAGAAGAVATADKASAKIPVALPKKLDLGTIALIGTAVGGVSALAAGIVEALFGLGLWLPVALAGAVFLVSGPSMVLASLKLRRRNVGPILEANGWAINNRALVNIPFGATMTAVAALPAGGVRLLADPFAQKRGGARRFGAAFVVALAVAAALSVVWLSGALDASLPAALSGAAAFRSIGSLLRGFAQ